MDNLEDEFDLEEEESSKFENIFVDREPQRNVFEGICSNLRVDTLKNKVFLLTYSGIGGIGKTHLLANKFREIADNRGKRFISYDFSESTDMIDTLKALRNELEDKCQIEFPLFDRGLIYLTMKREFVSEEEKTAVLRSSSLFSSFKKKITPAVKTTEKTGDVSKFAKDFLENVDNDAFDDIKTLVSDAADTVPITKAFKIALNFVDNMIANCEEYSRKKNDTYSKVVKKLKELNENNDPTPLKEFLPTLLAQDISFQLTKEKDFLIICLDTYEKLTGEEQDKKKMVRLSNGRDVPVDWWVGRLLAADNVIWVIAGRYEIKKIGLVSEKTLRSGFFKAEVIDAFDKNFSDEYLRECGINEPVLLNGIFKRTGGHPFYLRQCSIIYDNKKNNNEPVSLSDFGEKKEEIIERAIGTFDKSSRDLIRKLCILGKWTDEIITEVITEYNPDDYKRLKNYFAEKSSIDLYGREIIVYSFNRVITAFLLPSLKDDIHYKATFSKIRNSVNEYIKKIFGETKLNFGQEDPSFRWGSDRETFYLNIWAEIILRTTNNPAELMAFYEENIAPHEFDFNKEKLEAIVQKFFNRVGDNLTLPSAYFQYYLGKIKFGSNLKEATELINKAISKIQKISVRGNDWLFKIRIKMGLADTLALSGHYKNELDLRKEILNDCERNFPDKDITIEAQRDLAYTFSSADKAEDAFKIFNLIAREF